MCLKRLINYKTFITLVFITLLGVLFRTYNLVDLFGFAHDADLYSWIAKDIIVNGNIRLIGQQTSAEGVYIGSLFYYLLVPLFTLFNMDPIGSAYLAPIVGAATILSYYFCFSRLFHKTAGLTAAFIHAISLSSVGFDRWIVPTITTKLWAIWYLYTLIMLARGNFRVLPILGILIALTWHIHLALLPALIAIPIAIYVSKKLPSLKQSLYSLASLIFFSIPFLVFETRNNFLQISSILQSFSHELGGSTGWYKAMIVTEFIAKNTNDLFFYPNSISGGLKFIPLLVVGLSTAFLIRKQILRMKETILMFSWILGILLYFSLSSKPISEYYFINFEVIIIAVISLLFSYFMGLSKAYKSLVISFFVILLVRNFQINATTDPIHTGYKERKAVAEFISNDIKAKNYPCVGINYITYPGENVGFRYFFYLYNLKLAPPSNNVPVYSIVYPYSWSEKEIAQSYGPMGVILPAKVPDKKTLDYHCSGANTNLTEPVLGFVE